MAVLRARVCVFVGVCVLACPCLCGCGCGFACIFSCMTTTSCTAALNIGDSVGSIEQGKVGDIVVCVLRRLWRWLWLPPSSRCAVVQVRRAAVGARDLPDGRWCPCVARVQSGRMRVQCLNEVTARQYLMQNTRVLGAPLR